MLIPNATESSLPCLGASCLRRDRLVSLQRHVGKVGCRPKGKVDREGREDGRGKVNVSPEYHTDPLLKLTGECRQHSRVSPTGSSRHQQKPAVPGSLEVRTWFPCRHECLWVLRVTPCLPAPSCACHALVCSYRRIPEH